ncbi:MAG: helix-turn-helix domain-containing protein [Planctomycetes bacterium]|nr:helix-turn-helix domain-containing protein [Planctomycetota bacterium]
MAANASRSHRSRDRMMAIRALLLGESFKTVYRIFNISPRTLQRWVARFNERGIDGLIELDHDVTGVGPTSQGGDGPGQLSLVLRRRGYRLASPPDLSRQDQPRLERTGQHQDGDRHYGAVPADHASAACFRSQHVDYSPLKVTVVSVGCAPQAVAPRGVSTADSIDFEVGGINIPSGRRAAPPVRNLAPGQPGPNNIDGTTPSWMAKYPSSSPHLNPPPQTGADLEPARYVSNESNSHHSTMGLNLQSSTPGRVVR